MKRMFFQILSILAMLLLVSCYADIVETDDFDQTEDTLTSLSQVKESFQSDEGTFCATTELGEESWGSPITYEDFYREYSAFHGKWKLGEMCDSAKIEDFNTYYIIENCLNEVLEIAEDGIKVLGNYYTPKPDSLRSFLSYYTKSEICTFCGYLDRDKVPFPETDEIFEFFDFCMGDDNIAKGSMEDFWDFSLCMYGEQDKLFIGIDGAYFIAERIASA